MTIQFICQFMRSLYQRIILDHALRLSMNNVYADRAGEDPEMKVHRGGRNINTPRAKGIVAEV